MVLSLQITLVTQTTRVVSQGHPLCLLRVLFLSASPIFPTCFPPLPIHSHLVFIINLLLFEIGMNPESVEGTHRRKGEKANCAVCNDVGDGFHFGAEACR